MGSEQTLIRSIAHFVADFGRPGGGARKFLHSRRTHCSLDFRRKCRERFRLDFNHFPRS